MAILRPVNLRWIRGSVDDPKDLCAHGDVEFRIEDDILLDPTTTGKDFTVSASALYLLRTLASPHTQDAPVGEHLFPCCGFSMFDLPEQEDVFVCECPRGEDFEVLHEIGGSGILVRSEDGREWRVGWPEWRAAVYNFADRVSEFYASCSPKQPSEGDAQGFRKFAAEWERRRGKRLDVTITQSIGE
jgi:hypothetical protein